MPKFKPAYLIHGDEHGRIAERRARLRALAEAESGSGGVEIFEGERATTEAVAAALSSMTLAIGRRFVIVDGVERWKDPELDTLDAALRGLGGETTVAFFAREEGRLKAPPRLHEAVQAVGGDISPEQAIKPWELPRWSSARARELGLTLDAGAARALVASVGERPQRLVRELEKLRLELGPDAHIEPQHIEELVARSAERRVWSLADALVARDAAAATRTYLQLRAQGERVAGLLYTMAQRVRLALDVAERLEAGATVAQVKRGLKLPPKAAERLLADVQRSDVGALRDALGALADLELACRGGAAPLSEDTATVQTIARIAA